jgi:hypothetical protein
MTFPLVYRVFDRARRPPTPVTDWKAQVVQADPGWAKASVQPITYAFSNGRGFSELERPGAPYSWMGTST